MHILAMYVIAGLGSYAVLDGVAEVTEDNLYHCFPYAWSVKYTSATYV